MRRSSSCASAKALPLEGGIHFVFMTAVRKAYSIGPGAETSRKSPRIGHNSRTAYASCSGPPVERPCGVVHAFFPFWRMFWACSKRPLHDPRLFPHPLPTAFPGKAPMGHCRDLHGVAMATLDTAIANVALPAIAADLHVSPAESGLGRQCLSDRGGRDLLPLGALGEIVGHRRVFSAAWCCSRSPHWAARWPGRCQPCWSHARCRGWAPAASWP